MIIEESTKVAFANEKLEKEPCSLSENSPLRKHISRAIKDVQENSSVGIQIPKEYRKCGVNNLWKYGLPDDRRLIYTITTPTKIEIISVILEWFDHKNYAKRFKYRK